MTCIDNQNRLKTNFKKRISVQIKFFMSLLLAYLSTKWYNLSQTDFCDNYIINRILFKL